MNDGKQHIYEPVNEFAKVFRAKHEENVKAYFEELVTRAGVDEASNQATVKVIDAQKEKLKLLGGQLSSKRGLKTFLIVLIVIFFIACAVLIFDLVDNKSVFPSLLPVLNYVFIALGLGLNGLFIFIIVKKINSAIKRIQSIIAKEEKVLRENLDLAWQQVKSLNDLFDWSMTNELIEKTIPLLDFDPYYKAERADYMFEKYGVPPSMNKDQTVEFVQSGQIFGNPFLLMRILNHNLGSKTYTGTKVITWTETIRVNNRTQTVTRTQTLTATVTKPCPYYHDQEMVVYCNDAAPDLSFRRVASKANSMNDKEIERFVRKNEDDLTKKTRKSIAKGQNFQAMSNSEFELLFGAYDRNHEIQYRLLFTPLAQREMLNVIKDKAVGYGDDFAFIKEKQVNYIIPEHLQNFDLDASPDNYTHYDLKEISRRFNDYNNAYFKHFYFAMSPLLAIPLYQQHKPVEYIYKDVYPQKMASYDHEAHVNALDPDLLKHKESRTRNILKTEVVGRDGDLDKVKVVAYGYQTFQRTDYIPMRGRDGRTHQVPVNWIEYIPVERSSRVYIKVADGLDRPTFNKKIATSDEWVNNLERLFGDKNNALVRGKTITFLREQDFVHDDNTLLDKILQPKD